MRKWTGSRGTRPSSSRSRTSGSGAGPGRLEEASLAARKNHPQFIHSPGSLAISTTSHKTRYVNLETNEPGRTMDPGPRTKHGPRTTDGPGTKNEGPRTV